MSEKGLRYNEGKLRWSLLPLEPIVELIKVLEAGTLKYTKDNWKKFTKEEADENCYDSMMRHIQKWRMGETHDDETELHHMAHVMCNALFILWHSLSKDSVDRIKYKRLWEAQSNIPIKPPSFTNAHEFNAKKEGGDNV